MLKILKALKEMIYYAGTPIVDDEETHKVKRLGSRVKRNEVA